MKASVGERAVAPMGERVGRGHRSFGSAKGTGLWVSRYVGQRADLDACTCATLIELATN